MNGSQVHAAGHCTISHSTAEAAATARVPLGLAHSALLAASELLDQPAIVGRGQTWTWRQVHQASIDLSRSFRHGSAVCNLCTSQLGFLVTWLAALRSNAFLVLPPSGGHADISSVLESTLHSVVVADHSNVVQCGWSSSAQCLLVPPVSHAPKASAADLVWQPDWDRTAALLYTSGSTQAPRPQPKTLRHLTTGAQVLGARLAQEIAGGLGAIQRIVCSVPPQHMFGLEASVMLSLVHAIPVQEGRPLLPADVQQAFAGSHAAMWITTPMHLRALVQSGETMSNCNLVVASTMPLSQHLALQTERLIDASVLEIYGSTETGVVATRRSAREVAWHPVGGVRVESVNEGTLAYGSHFSSPVRLADEIERAATGGFKLVGRSTDMIKIGGRRASLAGLNLLLGDLPGLEDGVFYLPTTTNPTERMCLIYAGPSLNRADVDQWLRDRIDPAFLPRTLVHVDKLPRSDNGKIPRHALDALFAAWQCRGAQLDTAGET